MKFETNGIRPGSIERGFAFVTFDKSIQMKFKILQGDKGYFLTTVDTHDSERGWHKAFKFINKRVFYDAQGRIIRRFSEWMTEQYT